MDVGVTNWRRSMNSCLLLSAAAAPVGVPGRPLRRHPDGRPAVGGPLPAASRVRGLWGGGHPGPQTHEGQLERRRLPHQRQHQADEGGRRTGVSQHWTHTPLSLKQVVGRNGI